VVFQPFNQANPSNWQPFFHFGSAKVTEGLILCNPEQKLFQENGVKKCGKGPKTGFLYTFYSL
jgi:hypothetical protein